MKTLLKILLLTFVATNTYSQYLVEWNTAPNSGFSELAPMVRDSFGNVYISGFSNNATDYYSMKHNKFGGLLWIRTYEGPGNSGDYITANSIDRHGNYYVTGYSVGAEGNRDYLTIKYDSNGNESWIARHNGPNNSEDNAYSIALDTTGNVYVTGSSHSGFTSFDYSTIKYNSLGVKQWVRNYNHNNSEEHASKVLLDNFGNVYVTGISYDLSSRFDVATIKYDSNGNELWVRRYNGPGNDIEDFVRMVLDDSGNVYVSCASTGLQGLDFAVIKYNTEGVQKWLARYNVGGAFKDYPLSIAVDKRRNVFVTGKSEMNGSNDYDFTTIKINSTGSQVWLNRYGGLAGYSDAATSVTCDSLGFVYVTGATIDSYASDYDLTTIKYDSTGNQVWRDTYIHPNGEFSGQSIVDPGGKYLFVSGSSYVGGLTIIKYSKTLPQPVLVSPANNSYNIPLTANFVWRRSNTDPVQYSLQISKDSAFMSSEFNDSGIVDTFKTIIGLEHSVKYFWRVVAEDIYGNRFFSSQWSFQTIPGITLKMRTLIEGLYYPLFNIQSRRDTVRVYLRDISPPYVIRDSAKSTIDSLSFQGLFKFPNATTGVYFIVVKHFQGIETWSKAGGVPMAITDTTVYDFTTSSSQAFGNNLKHKGSIYCIYSGDLNQSGFVDATELSMVENDAAQFLTGRFALTDINGDEIVDASDYLIVDNNAFSFIGVIRP